MRSLFFLVGLLGLAPTAGAADFEVGEVWSYSTRPGDELSLVLINYVEEVPNLGVVYHISVLRHVRASDVPPRRQFELPHLPVLKESLEASVIELVGHQKPLDSYRRGYEIWRAAFKEGRAGAFSIPIAEIIESIEQSAERATLQTSNTSLERTRER
jgi:hypothetical protein